MRRFLPLVLTLVALAVPSAAAAAVTVKGADVSRFPRVAVTVVTSEVTTRPPALRENGRRVVGLESENLGRAKSVVLAIDRSRSMQGAAMADAVRAAREFVESKPARDRISVVAFGSRAVQLSKFSASTIDADIALRDLDVDRKQGTALNDAIALGARALGDETLAGRVLIVLTDGRDVSSVATAASAIEAARRAGVVVYPIGIESEQFSPAVLERFADATGGSYHGASSSAAVGDAYAAVARELRRTWRLTYFTAARPGERLRLDVAVPGSAPAHTEVRLAGTAPAPEKPSRILPRTAYSAPGGALVVGLLVGGLVLLACVLLASSRKTSSLRRRLAPHVEAGRRGKQGPERERFATGAALLLATENAFGHLNLWRKVQRLLERADLPLRTVEFLYIALGSSFVLALLFAVTGSSSFMILLALVGGGVLPFGFAWFKAKRRLKAFENQLPDLLLTIAASLKAGHSFKSGIQTVVDEGMPPASKEFGRVLAETRLGRPMDDALEEMAQRVGSKDLEFVVTAVAIQTQVGGSLAGLFDLVADLVRQRQQFARKIRGLTSMGRASAYVLIGLPFFIAFVITLMNREYMDPLYNTSTGHMLIVTGLVMMALGSLMLKKIVSFRG